MSLQQIISNLLGRPVGRQKHVPQLTREQRLSARPMRNPGLEWHENDDGEVVIILPRRRDTLGKVLNWMFQVPEKKPVTMDEVGSLVWRHCDGNHTFGELLDLMSKKYQVSTREVEMSLGQFMQTLGKRGMVTALVPKEVVDQLDEADRKALGLMEMDGDAAADEPEDEDKAGADPDAEKDTSAAPDMPEMQSTEVFGVQPPGKRR